MFTMVKIPRTICHPSLCHDEWIFNDEIVQSAGWQSGYSIAGEIFMKKRLAEKIVIRKFQGRS